MLRSIAAFRKSFADVAIVRLFCSTSCRFMPRGGRQLGEVLPDRGMMREKEKDDAFGRRIETSFGSVRYDPPTADVDATIVPPSSGLNAIDEEYFGSYFGGEAEKIREVSQMSSESRATSGSLPSEELNLVDEEYFGSYFHEHHSSSSSANASQEAFAPTAEVECQADFHVVDAQYFGSYFRTDAEEKFRPADYPGMGLFGGSADVIRFSSSSVDVGSQFADILAPKRPSEGVTLPPDSVVGSDKSMLQPERSPTGNDREVNAFNFAVMSRVAELKAKGHGTRWFGYDFRKMTRNEVYKLLCSSVIYNENDIVAFDKPYGMACQGGKPGDVAFISQHLDRLGKDLGAKDGKLHFVHRIDKGCTGVVVFAKTPEMAALLQSSFVQRKVIKIYWAILKGTPQPHEGIIDIPIGEGRVGDRRRMTLRPVFNRPGGGPNSGTNARTYYKVINSKGNAALVELRPETGVKHQLRVHTSFGLSCGILGDHKYAHRDKLAPQTLNGSILTLLGIRQQEVRNLPIHLHAKCLVFPELLDGRNLFIRADVPRGFRKTLKMLRLRVPS